MRDEYDEEHFSTKPKDMWTLYPLKEITGLSPVSQPY